MSARRARASWLGPWHGAATLLVCASAGAAPAPPLDGVVLRRGDRTPMADVAVALDDREPVRTDERGHFHLDAVAPGAHTLKLRGADIVPLDVPATTAATAKATTIYVVGRAPYQSRVRGERTTAAPLAQRLEGDDVRHLAGTQGDLLRAVSTLPGVARAPLGLPQLVVWGSAPEDTRVYADGVAIPTLYHFGALRSTVNSEMVDALTFQPGGYGVEYGRGLGGIVEVETRRPRSDGYHGFVQLDLFDGSLMVEGPITRRLSFAVAARRSWADALLSIFAPGFSFYYWDYQLKLDWRPSARDELELFWFGSDDRLVIDSTTTVTSDQPDMPAMVTRSRFETHTFYHRLLVRWRHRLGQSGTLSMTPSIGWDLPLAVSSSGSSDGDARVDGHRLQYGLRAAARVRLATWARLDAGVDFEGSWQQLSASGRPMSMAGAGSVPPDAVMGRRGLHANHTAPYAALQFAFFGQRLRISPQLRVDVYDFVGASGRCPHACVEVEPRLQMRWQLSRRVALKGAIGLYHQPPEATALLVGAVEPTPALALHYVAGVDVDPLPGLHVEVEGFYKELRQLSPPVLPTLTIGEGVDSDTGRAYGAELLVRQQLWKGLSGWISYTLSRSERRDASGAWVPFTYDQTHILSVQASYQFGRGYQVGLRFRYVSGNPYTPIVGSYYDTNDQQFVGVPGARLGARLGGFHQLDLRFDKTWLFNRFSMSAYLDVQNVYNAQPEEAKEYNFDYTRSRGVAGLPIFPVAGVRGSF